MAAAFGPPADVSAVLVAHSGPEILASVAASLGLPSAAQLDAAERHQAFLRNTPVPVIHPEIPGIPAVAGVAEVVEVHAVAPQPERAHVPAVLEVHYVAPVAARAERPYVARIPGRPRVAARAARAGRGGAAGTAEIAAASAIPAIPEVTYLAPITAVVEVLRVEPVEGVPYRAAILEVFAVPPVAFQAPRDAVPRVPAVTPAHVAAAGNLRATATTAYAAMFEGPHGADNRALAERAVRDLGVVEAHAILPALLQRIGHQALVTLQFQTEGGAGAAAPSDTFGLSLGAVRTLAAPTLPSRFKTGMGALVMRLIAAACDPTNDHVPGSGFCVPAPVPDRAAVAALLAATAGTPGTGQFLQALACLDQVEGDLGLVPGAAHLMQTFCESLFGFACARLPALLPTFFLSATETAAESAIAGQLRLELARQLTRDATPEQQAANDTIQALAKDGQVKAFMGKFDRLDSGTNHMLSREEIMELSCADVPPGLRRALMSKRKFTNGGGDPAGARLAPFLKALVRALSVIIEKAIGLDSSNVGLVDLEAIAEGVRTMDVAVLAGLGPRPGETTLAIMGVSDGMAGCATAVLAPRASTKEALATWWRFTVFLMEPLYPTEMAGAAEYGEAQLVRWCRAHGVGVAEQRLIIALEGFTGWIHRSSGDLGHRPGDNYATQGGLCPSPRMEDFLSAGERYHLYEPAGVTNRVAINRLRLAVTSTYPHGQPAFPDRSGETVPPEEIVREYTAVHERMLAITSADLAQASRVQSIRKAKARVDKRPAADIAGGAAAGKPRKGARQSADTSDNAAAADHSASSGSDRRRRVKVEQLPMTTAADLATHQVLLLDMAHRYRDFTKKLSDPDRFLYRQLNSVKDRCERQYPELIKGDLRVWEDTLLAIGACRDRVPAAPGGSPGRGGRGNGGGGGGGGGSDARGRRGGRGRRQRQKRGGWNQRDQYDQYDQYEPRDPRPDNRPSWMSAQDAQLAQPASAAGRQAAAPAPTSEQAAVRALDQYVRSAIGAGFYVPSGHSLYRESPATSAGFDREYEAHLRDAMVATNLALASPAEAPRQAATAPRTMATTGGWMYSNPGQLGATDLRIQPRHGFGPAAIAGGLAHASLQTGRLSAAALAAAALLVDGVPRPAAPLAGDTLAAAVVRQHDTGVAADGNMAADTARVEAARAYQEQRPPPPVARPYAPAQGDPLRQGAPPLAGLPSDIAGPPPSPGTADLESDLSASERDDADSRGAHYVRERTNAPVLSRRHGALHNGAVPCALPVTFAAMQELARARDAAATKHRARAVFDAHGPPAHELPALPRRRGAKPSRPTTPTGLAPKKARARRARGKRGQKTSKQSAAPSIADPMPGMSNNGDVQQQRVSRQTGQPTDLPSLAGPLLDADDMAACCAAFWNLLGAKRPPPTVTSAHCVGLDLDFGRNYAGLVPLGDEGFSVLVTEAARQAKVFEQNLASMPRIDLALGVQCPDWERIAPDHMGTGRCIDPATGSLVASLERQFASQAAEAEQWNVPLGFLAGFALYCREQGLGTSLCWRFAVGSYPGYEAWLPTCPLGMGDWGDHPDDALHDHPRPPHPHPKDARCRHDHGGYAPKLMSNIIGCASGIMPLIPQQAMAMLLARDWAEPGQTPQFFPHAPQLAQPEARRLRGNYGRPAVGMLMYESPGNGRDLHIWPERTAARIAQDTHVAGFAPAPAVHPVHASRDDPPLCNVIRDQTGVFSFWIIQIPTPAITRDTDAAGMPVPFVNNSFDNRVVCLTASHVADARHFKRPPPRYTGGTSDSRVHLSTQGDFIFFTIDDSPHGPLKYTPEFQRPLTACHWRPALPIPGELCYILVAEPGGRQYLEYRVTGRTATGHWAYCPVAGMPVSFPGDSGSPVFNHTAELLGIHLAVGVFFPAAWMYLDQDPSRFNDELVSEPGYPPHKPWAWTQVNEIVDPPRHAWEYTWRQAQQHTLGHLSPDLVTYQPDAGRQRMQAQEARAGLARSQQSQACALVPAGKRRRATQPPDTPGIVDEVAASHAASCARWSAADHARGHQRRIPPTGQIRSPWRRIRAHWSLADHDRGFQLRSSHAIPLHTPADFARTRADLDLLRIGLPSLAHSTADATAPEPQGVQRAPPAALSTDERCARFELVGSLPLAASTTLGAFASEPVFCRPAASQQQVAACERNALVPADLRWVLQRPFLHTNVPVPTAHAAPPTFVFPAQTKRPWQWDPSAWYKPTRFEAALQGDFVLDLVRHFLGPASQATGLELLPHQIVESELIWLAIAKQDILHHLPVADGGLKTADSPPYRVRARHLIVPAHAFRWPGVFFDSRDWDSSGFKKPITCIGPETPARRPHNTAAIRHPYPGYQAIDQEVEDWAVNGTDPCTLIPRCSVVNRNHMSFYTHCASAVRAVISDLDLKILQGPFRFFPIHPVRCSPSSVVEKPKDGVLTYRKCVDCGDAANPLLGGEDISRNGGEFLGAGGHPSLHDCEFPTPLCLAHNLAIIFTLEDLVRAHWGEPTEADPVFAFSPETGFSGVTPSAFVTAVGCADMKRWYRQFAVALSHLWMQCAMIHPGGPTLDLGMQFGDAGAVQTAQRRLTQILAIVKDMLQASIDRWTCWQIAPGPLPPAPQTRDWSAGPPGWVRKPPGSASPTQCWDWHHVVAHWRDIRYRAALERGMPSQDAWLEATPMGSHGYIDDSLKGTVLLFIFMWFRALADYCKACGILMSLAKSQVVDSFGRRWLMDADGNWGTPGRGPAVALGKVVDLVRRNVRDTEERVAATAAEIRDYLDAAGVRAARLQKRTETGLFDDLEHLLGVLRYHAKTNPGMVPLLQWPTRCLFADVALGDRSGGAKATAGLRVRITGNCRAALELARTSVLRNDGVALCPDRSPIDWTTAIWLVHDAAGKSDKDDYRGHFTWIVIPGARHTYYVKGRWNPQQLENHSTTLETAGSNVGLREAYLRCPPGDFVEAFDSQSATGCATRLACRSPTMVDVTEERGAIHDAAGVRRRLFAFFFLRKYNTLADNGSKDLLATVEAQLMERGLPPLRHWATSPSKLEACGVLPR